MLNAKTMLTNISKGQSSIPLRYLIQGLENDYMNLRSMIQIYHVSGNSGKTILYFKVPSSSVKNFFYDCIFEFAEPITNKITSNSNFKVYCNSPSFYFRYGNIFKRYGALLYPEKYPRLLDTPAEMRNKSQVTGFDKYVYSCLRVATQLTTQQMIDSMVSQVPPRIPTYDEKISEYKRLKGEQESIQD